MGSFSIFHWIIFGAIIWMIFAARNSLIPKRGAASADGPMVCPSCGTRGQPSSEVRGSFAIEIVLWLMFIIPGIIYSLWRVSTRTAVCPACKQPGMIPANSPNGQRLIKQNESP